MSIDLELHTVDLDKGTSTEVSAVDGATGIDLVPSKFGVEGHKKEYSIIGDGLYAQVSAESAPQWLLSIIDEVLAVNLANGLTSLDDAVAAINTALGELDIAKNQYQELINIEATIDSIITSRLTTLNATVGTNSASIVTLDSTKVTADQALAIAADHLSSELLDGDVSAALTTLESTLTTPITANADSISVLSTSINDPSIGLTATASAMDHMQSYVGLVKGTPDGTGLLADVAILQKQNDGVIETTTGTYDVMLGVENPNNSTGNDELIETAEPYASWKSADVASGTEEERARHVGDVYIQYTSGDTGYKTYDRAYKFVKTVVDSTSPFATDSEGYTWALITDTDAQNAYVAALNALDLADDKRRVFVVQPTAPYDVGDLWLVDALTEVPNLFPAVEVGDILRCTESKTGTGTYESNDWVRADNYRASLNAVQDDLDTWRNGDYSDFVLDIQGQVDGKAESYYIENMPHPEGSNSDYSVWVGDLWKKPGDNTEYIYQLVGGIYKWVKTDVPDIVYDTIDTKKTIYTGNDVPIPSLPDKLEENDMWIVGSTPSNSSYDKEEVYVWNGSSWVKPLRYTDDTAVTILQNGLSDGTVAVDLSSATIDGTTPLDTFVANQIDDQVVVFSGTDVSSQTGMKADDIYIEKTTEASSSGVVVDVLNTYRYTGSSWTKIGNNSNLTGLADLADGKRTVFAGTTIPSGAEERDLWIPEADVSGYIQGEIYQYKGTSWTLATKYSSEIDSINTDLSQKELELANLDGKIDAEEQARILAVSAEEQARIDAIQERVLEDARLDGVISAEEQARIDAVNDVSDAYKEYSRIVTLAISDGVLTTAEQATISAAQAAVNAAKDRLQDIADTAEENLGNFVDQVYTPKITTLENQIDGKVDIYYQNTAPYPNGTNDANKNGDLWYDLDDKLLYVYQNSITTWSLVEDQTAINAVTDAATAQATADGKITTYYGTKASTVGEAVGDLLVASDEDNKLYRWDGATWIDSQDKGIVANAQAITDLDATVNDPVTGTIASAVNSLEQSVNSSIVDGLASVESKFAYDSTLNINGNYYNSGFGLNSSLIDPGSGIPVGESEFWINADKFRFTNTGQTGTATPFSIDAGGAVPNVTFNGLVTFGNSQTGTVDEAITASIETKGVATEAFAEAQVATVTDNIYYPGTTEINGGAIRTGTVSANTLHGGVLYLDGLAPFTPSPGFSGSVGDSNGIRVYNNGIARVRIGKL